MKDWSTTDIPDLTGLTAVVTGATSGIGLETGRELARKGASVVLAARNEVKATRIISDLTNELPSAEFVYHHLDVSSLHSVRSFADWYLALDQPLDLLINNAGIMMVPYGVTDDGNEQQFATNHLGHFALTGLLLASLRSSNAARVITVSSIAHKEADIDFENLQYPGGKAYTPMRAYRRSKLANLLFAFELDRRLHAERSPIRSIAAHPGVSNTNLGNENNERLLWRLFRPVASVVLQGPAAGALPTLRAATDPDALSGEYYGPSRFGETTGAPVGAHATSLARDPAHGRELWEVSAKLSNVDYLQP